MARTKQTARKSSGGKAPRRMLAAKSASQLRTYLTGRQAATYASAKPSKQKKTSYINYENMFYSYYFPTGKKSVMDFEPQFFSGAGKHPLSGQPEQWLGMSFSSKYDGVGMKLHGRPHLNLSIVLDVSGSMGSSFEQDFSSGTKLDVAKKCLQTLTDQINPSDRFGLVRFNHEAVVHCPMRTWSTVKKTELRREIGELRAYGMTSLSAAIDCAKDMFSDSFEHANSTSRIIFLTDLCSTVDSVNDECQLLATIRKNAERGIYTTVVGIGMDLNVHLVEEISKTVGAKYCSVDSAHEFQQIMNNEFAYDTTILAFDITVRLESPDYQLVKGYGSPELNAVKPDKPVLISSEFPSWQNEQGESKGGMMLFKMEKKKGRKNPANEVKVHISWREQRGTTHSTYQIVKLNDTFVDVGTRKAVLLVHYVDLQNDYVHDCRRNKMKFLEMFQSFRSHFVKELSEMGDSSWSTYNKGDLELVDKIVELEQNPDSSAAAPETSGFGPSVTFNPLPMTFHMPVWGQTPLQGWGGGPLQSCQSHRGAPKRLGRSTTRPKSAPQVLSAAQRKGGGRRSRGSGGSILQVQGKRIQVPSMVGQMGTRRSTHIASPAASSLPPETASSRGRKRKATSATSLFPIPPRKKFKAATTTTTTPAPTRGCKGKHPSAVPATAPSPKGRKRKAPGTPESKDSGPTPAKKQFSAAAKRVSTTAGNKVSAGTKKKASAGTKKKVSATKKKVSVTTKKKVSAATKKKVSAATKQSVSAAAKKSVSATAKKRVSAAAKKSVSAAAKKSVSAAAKKKVSAAAKKRVSAAAKKSVSAAAKKRVSAAAKKRVSAAAKKSVSAATKKSVSAVAKRVFTAPQQ